MKMSQRSVVQLAGDLLDADEALTLFLADPKPTVNWLPTPRELAKQRRLEKIKDEIERQLAAKIIAVRAAGYNENSGYGELDLITQGIINALLKGPGR